MDVKDVTTATGATVPAAAIEKLVFATAENTAPSPRPRTTRSPSRPRTPTASPTACPAANTPPTPTTRASPTSCTAPPPMIVAYAMHHLGELLPDLTEEQWARLDAAAVELDYRSAKHSLGRAAPPHRTGSRHDLECRRPRPGFRAAPRPQPDLSSGRGVGRGTAIRERETQQQLRAPADREPYASDPEELAELWTAKHAEWRRIARLVEASGWASYDPEQDEQGTDWAQERTERRQNALDGHGAWMKERQDAKEELRAQVWLSADVSRHLRAIAASTRLTPEQVLAELARHAELRDDDTLMVAPFRPR